LRDKVDGECPICNGPAATSAWEIGDYEEYACDRCGTFRMSGSALTTARSKSLDQKRGALSTAKRRQKSVNTVPMVEGLDFI
jgi:hypothetical protein